MLTRLLAPSADAAGVTKDDPGKTEIKDAAPWKQDEPKDEWKGSWNAGGAKAAPSAPQSAKAFWEARKENP